MASQTVGDLRTLVTRRAGLAQRVAVLAKDAALVAALKQNRCEVLEDPASLDELSAFAPTVVVAFDGYLSGGPGALEALARAAPGATFVCSFASSSSGGAALRAVLGQPMTPALAEKEVREGLRQAGYAVQSRDVVVVPHAPSGLSAETEAALRQLFEQLNPDAAIDRLLLVSTRGAMPAPIAREPGLLSVIVSAGADVPALEGTLASLHAQRQTPMEVLVASALGPETLSRVLARQRERAGLVVRAVDSAAADFAGRTNAALAVARGQYVGFCEAGDLFGPLHFSALVSALANATQAWVVPAVEQRAFSLPAWLDAPGGVDRAGWLLDRERLGAFALTFAEGTPLAEAALFTRLALLFTPSVLTGEVTLGRAVASTDVEALRTQFAGRPLRTLSTFEGLFAQPRLSTLLEARLTERLDAVRPGTGRAVSKALAWWRALPEK